ncbi:MAG: TrkH family potassium uptake protein [Clostridiales bacterium]|nr:TrkH family potassium uptake protein [Clostridiales bacterium]
MWVRLYSPDMRTILHFVGILVTGIGLAMIIPLVVGVLAREWDAALDFALGAGVSCAVGMALMHAEVRPSRMNHTHALAITALGWIAAAMAAALPLAFSDNYPSYLDACFDAISGLTVSGLTVAVDLDHMSYAHNMWRHLMQLIGGQGIVVAALSLAVGLRGGAFSLYVAEGRDERILPNIVHTARFIWVVTAVYVALGTATFFAIMSFIGMSPARSLLHGFWIAAAAFDTGGFAPQRMNLMYYHHYLIEALALILMMAGSINFALHAQIWRGSRRELRKNIETRVLAFVITAWSALVAIGLTYADTFTSAYGVFRKGVFQVISGHSAGHQTVYGSQFIHDFSGVGLIAIMLGMAVGGSLSSTGGGIKALRVGVIAKSIVLHVKQAIAPKSAAMTVRYHHLGMRVLKPEVVGAAATVFILYLVTYVVGGVAGAAYGYGASEAMFESISATANSGLSIGITSATMPTGLKLVYMFQMWAGRLEFIAVLVLVSQVVLAFDVRRWRSR